ncbi:MAG TPA: GAF domain-containing protein [Burkholderiales bacterium]|nr:GAF domain-containing protein [Burkholderiales bacterium]
MKTFVRACEVWVPSKSRTQLEYYGGLYPEAGNIALRQFRAASERMVFGYDEGLPGHAWAVRGPVVLKDLQHSYFKRSRQAKAAGLTCGIALPIFAGDYLLAVIVIYCGDDQEHFGAIEVWHAAPGADLVLADGYYGTALEFEAASRERSFKPGVGLPGTVWQSGMPEVMSELWFEKRFVRRHDGAPLGLSRGLALPMFLDDGHSFVMTFLSALGSPLARRFEIWTFDETPGAHEALVFAGGDCDLNKAFPQDYVSARIAHGEGPLGRVWASGLPEANADIAHDASVNGRSARKAGLTSLLALPVLAAGRLKAVVGLYF